MGLLLMSGCGPSQQRPAPPTPNPALAEVAEPGTAADHTSWDSIEGMLTGPAPTPQTQPAITVKRRTSQASKADGPWHALVLKTFPGDTEGNAASVWAQRLTILVPPLQPNLGIHRDRKGASVLYGHYSGWDDPQAEEDLRELSGLRVNDKRIFGPIIKTCVVPERDPASLHPHELISIWQRYPSTNRLYSLEIAVWGDFESGNLPHAARRQQAEAQVADLRSQGVNAWFHHDPIAELSMVTVGIFPESAVDTGSGLVSQEIELLQRRFPDHLTNGETLRLPIAGRPDLGAVPQRSRLVVIPER